MNDKRFLTTFLLLVFLGALGAHRFFVGRYISGFIYFITLGFFGFLIIVDFFNLISGKFKDREGIIV